MSRTWKQQANEAAFRHHIHPSLPLTCFLLIFYTMLAKQTSSTLFCSCLHSVSLFIFLLLFSFLFHFLFYRFSERTVLLCCWEVSISQPLTAETVVTYRVLFLYPVNSSSDQNFIYSPWSLVFTPFIYFSISLFPSTQY